MRLDIGKIYEPLRGVAPEVIEEVESAGKLAMPTQQEQVEVDAVTTVAMETGGVTTVGGEEITEAGSVELEGGGVAARKDGGVALSGEDGGVAKADTAATREEISTLPAHLTIKKQD